MPPFVIRVCIEGTRSREIEWKQSMPVNPGKGRMEGGGTMARIAKRIPTDARKAIASTEERIRRHLLGEIDDRELDGA